MLYPTFKRLMRSRFAQREDGSVAIEAVIILPLLFMTFLSLFSIFDAFNQYSANQKAAYTVGDMLSRETAHVDNDYLDGTHQLFDYLTRSPQESALRISLLKYNLAGDDYEVFWSQTRGWKTPLTTADVTGWNDRIPTMPDDEYVIITETWSKYEPPFKTGLENTEIRNFIFTRPRYAPCVLWDGMEGC